VVGWRHIDGNPFAGKFKTTFHYGSTYTKDGTAKNLGEHTSRFFIKLQKNICVLCNHESTRF
jgi:hypothetical protein